MTVEGHRQAKKIFSCAKGLKTEEREDFLQKSCGEDENLRREVETLLEFDEELERAERTAANPSEIGPFHVIRRLGEGGMGEVWEAEQEEPVRRRVALKLVKWGMDTNQVLARFEAERQALALMNHENIAKVHEAGASEDGRPYFAMELVDGKDIVQYCDANCLSVGERLRLFAQICSGVQHAHQKGVIHRDIKPSNVLVSVEDGRPVPKIIDFGVAKAVAQRLTERTLFTEMGNWIGTPEYMSPEQAELRCDDIDTRSDVYSLGVLLYELIAGAPPLDSDELRKAEFDEMRRRIREEDPVKPSTRVSRLGPAQSVAAANRRTDAPGLMKELRGDLDWIVLKALEKDRDRRYVSAAALADDICRNLRHEPVAASPPSAMYRLGKYVRRNRLTVVSAFLVIAALLAAIIGTGIGLLQAQKEARTARRVSHFMESMILDLDPFSMRGQTADPRQILDRSLARIDTELGDEPLERARLLMALGVAYNGLNLNSRAQKLLKESAAIRLEHLGSSHPDYAESLFYLGDLMVDMGDDEGALRYHTESLAIREAILPPGDPTIFLSVGRVTTSIYNANGCEDAQGMIERVFRWIEDETVPRSAEVEAVVISCGAVSAICGNESLAQSFLEYAGLLEDDVAHPDSLTKAQKFINYALVLDWLGKSEQARPYGDRALEMWEILEGPEDRSYYRVLIIISSIAANNGEYDRAQNLLERTLRAAQTSEDVGSDVPIALYSLARVHALKGEQEKALERLRQALAGGLVDDYILTDSAFESMRGVREYEAFLEEVVRELTNQKSVS